MISGKVKVYITVKTYPTISRKYAELVCTAGIMEDGSWIRLYPMPYRLLKDEQKYPKYSWIEVEVEKNTSDYRIESYRPQLDSIEVHPEHKKSGHVDWNERRRIVLENTKVYTNLQTIIDKAKNKDAPMSLAIFKPTKIISVDCERCDPNWDSNKLESLAAQARQMNLFQTEQDREEEFRVVQKIPYTFYYVFEDDEGKRSRATIEDWEIGMLYLNCLKSNDEKTAIEKVKHKFYDEYIKRDTYFFLGTTLSNHYISKNPFIVIGVFPLPMPPEHEQLSLF